MYQEKYKLHQREKTADLGNCLRTIALDVTTKCNMKCAQCYADTFANQEEVELKYLKKAIDELYDMGVCHYILQGGEPLADFGRLQAILNMIYPEETFINLVSNGWMMTKEVVYKLKELHVDKVTFSLDSGIEEEHDANRGKGSFERVKQGVEYVLESGMLAGISTVVTNQSLYSESFNKVYEYTQEKDIRLDVQIAMPVGKWDGQKEMLISKKDAEYIKQLYINSPIMANGQKMIKRDLYSKDLFGNHVDCCPAGSKFMAITATGEFLPCNFIQASLGNIRDKSLKQMREDLLKCDWFGGRHDLCICGQSDEYFAAFIKPNVAIRKPLDANQIFLKNILGNGVKEQV